MKVYEDKTFFADHTFVKLFEVPEGDDDWYKVSGNLVSFGEGEQSTLVGYD
jgi:hypothetical protein